MAVRVALEHKTEYRYARPVRLGPQVIRLRPAPHERSDAGSPSFAVTRRRPDAKPWR